MRLIIAFASGLVFSLGLIISGMTNPAKVVNCLDLAGAWDPSLALVMGGALTTTMIGYRLILPRRAPVFGDAFHLPETTAITPQLIVGSMLFGVGWGLSGLCPGPAVAVLPMSLPAILPFAAGLFVGLLAYQGYQQHKPA